MAFKKGCTPWNKNRINVYSDEILDSWSDKRKGMISPFKGKKHSNESIEKIKESIKNHPNRRGPKGKPWSEARKLAQKSRNGKPYKRNPRKKSVIKGGREYSPLWNEIRKITYKRDSYKCQECGVKCVDKKSKNTKNVIQCHHIDYDTTNNDLSNLITLCASCHGKTRFKRIDWMNYFSEITKGKYYYGYCLRSK